MARQTDYVPTDEDDAIYRRVRRYYAALDVERMAEDLGLTLDEEQFENAVDRYDEWQGDNEEWWPALETIIDGILWKPEVRHA